MTDLELSRRTFAAALLLTTGGGTAAGQKLAQSDGDGDESEVPDTFVPPAGVEVVDRADGYEALQGVLDEYGQAPVTILLTEGTLTVDTNVVVPSNTWLMGVGRQTVIKLADGTTFDVSGVVRVKKRQANIVLSDFVIDGNRENVTNEGHEYGFFTKNAKNVLCERLVIRECPGYGFDPHAAAEWETTFDLRILDCEAYNNGKDGITIAGVEDCVVDSCIARNNDRYGVNVTDPDCREITVSNTISTENGASGIVVHNDPRFVTLANNRVHHNGEDGIKVATQQMPVSHCSIIGNTIRRNGRYGISVLRGHDITVVGNNLRANALESGNAEIRLAGNEEWNAHNCLIVGNTVHGTDSMFSIDERNEQGEPNAVIGNVVTGAEKRNINRQNGETMVAFNIGDSFQMKGTATVPSTSRRVEIPDSAPQGSSYADVQLTPQGPLGAASSYWVESTLDGYAIVLDSQPGESVPFSYEIDSRS